MATFFGRYWEGVCGQDAKEARSQSESHNTEPCEGIMWYKESICEPRNKKLTYFAIKEEINCHSIKYPVSPKVFDLF